MAVDELTIERERELQPAGALPGSEVAVRVLNVWELDVAASAQ